MASATLYSPSYSTARCGGLSGAGGMSTDAKIAANIERGFCPKNRSAAVVPSARVRQKLCTAVRRSHLEGVVSELIVPSDHAATAHPFTVLEVKRILRLHLQQASLPSS
jgi:hypothetical protein